MKKIKNRTRLIVVISAAVLFGCNKKNNDTTPVDHTPKVKTYTSNFGNVTSHQYDAQGRKTVESSGIYSTSYSYMGNQISEKNYTSGSLNGETIYHLDGAGRTTRYGEPGSVWESRSEYDGSGHMIRDYNLQSGVITTDTRFFYGATGRLDSVYSYNSGVLQRRDVFTTDETHQNTIGSENLGYLFFGKQPTGVIKKVVRTNFSNGVISQLDYSHSYDADGRIITETLNGTSTTTYTYH